MCLLFCGTVSQEPGFRLEKRVCLHTLCALQQGIVQSCSWMLGEGAAGERQAQPVVGPEPAGSYSSV